MVLPRAQVAIIALGFAFAYSAAVDANVSKPLLDVFESLAVSMDEVWYAEHGGLSQEKRVHLENEAVLSALPHVKDYVDALDLRKYANVPIRSDETWDDWVPLLKAHQRDATILYL